MLVGIFTAQMLQDAHLTDIGAQRKQSTPTDAADAEIGQNALATLRVSNQQSAGASDRNDSAHQGEWERRSGPRPGCDPVAITPILEHAAPELLAVVRKVFESSLRRVRHEAVLMVETA